MKQQRSLRRAPIVVVIGVLVAAGACTKKASPAKPTAAKPTPAKPVPAADQGKPSAKGGPLPTPFDLSKLDADKRKVYDQVVNREPSACGKGHSLLYSVEHDSGCRASFYAVRYVARLADAGASESEIGEKLQLRFRTPRVASIDVSKAPSMGSPSARVKIIEFADYQCTHCKEAQALMHSLLAEYGNDVVLYFKHFPFSQHMNALNAARAAAAAQKQGKFWQYHDKIWQNQERLFPAVLEGMAKEIGLDFKRWIEDVGSEEVRAHVQQDRNDGLALGIRRTPAIFINGRLYNPDELDLASMKDWLDEELGR
jgi:protein-disulfide isomerase